MKALWKMFWGVHEVAAMRRDGVLVAGHFDNEADALVAMAALDSPRAVWITANTLCVLPDGRVLNPPRLTRGSRAGARHVGKRTRLLFDFDPPRPVGVMSTAGELEAALAQATECQTWLHSLGWPSLPMGISGSGIQTWPRVELDNSEASTALVKRVLQSLRQKFSFVDVGMWDLPRLCRYFGTWNRKGEDTALRPWRQSAVLEAGEDTPVTIAQLKALCELLPVPEIKSSGDGIARPAAVAKFIRRFVAYCDGLNVETSVRTLPAGKVLISTSPCLLWDDHDGGAGITPDGVRCVQCFHSRCQIGWARWARAVEEKFKRPMRLDGSIAWRKE